MQGSERRVPFAACGLMSLPNESRARSPVASSARSASRLPGQLPGQLPDQLPGIAELLQEREWLLSENRRLDRLATLDPLTDVLNRRAFFELFEALFSVAKRDGTPLGCMMVDIDYFKSVNDTFGHALGDIIIHHVAKVMAQFAGDGGIVARLGGEEFCLLIPGHDEAATMKTAEQVRSHIESGRDASFADQLGVTASVGVSALPARAQTTHQLIELADKALYLAKDRGRNRVVGHETDTHQRLAAVAALAGEEADSQAVAELDDEPGIDSTSVVAKPVGRGHETQASRSPRSAGTRRRRDDTSAVVGARIIVEHDAAPSERQLLLHEIEAAVSRAGHVQDLMAILVLDSRPMLTIARQLDGDLGSRLCAALVGRLGNLMRTRDVVSQSSRLSHVGDIADPGADEHSLAILVNDIDRVESVPIIIERVLSVYRQPIMIDGFEYRLETAIGISVFGVDGDCGPQLLSEAMQASRQARLSGEINGYRFACPAMDEEARRKLRLQSDLGLSMDRDELAVVYQPKLDLVSGLVLGFETLLRWDHPGFGRVSPAEFISLAEKSGLIKAISQWVLRKAAEQQRQWQDEGLPTLPIAINISAVELQDERTAPAFLDIVGKFGLEPSLFELEITESMGIESHEIARGTLQILRESGFSIAIDDFGTGYASLNYLQQLPIDRLKIDRCFVDQLGADERSIRVVRAIISLGDSLDMRVVAEGVETLEQLRFLIRAQCDEVQGYLLSRPVDAERATAMLRDPQRLAALIIDARLALTHEGSLPLLRKAEAIPPGYAAFRATGTS